MNQSVLPDCFKSVAVRKRLKAKWVKEAGSMRIFGESNIKLMRLGFVAGELTGEDPDELTSCRTTDSDGKIQQARIVEFLGYV